MCSITGAGWGKVGEQGICGVRESQGAAGSPQARMWGLGTPGRAGSVSGAAKGLVGARARWASVSHAPFLLSYSRSRGQTGNQGHQLRT